MNFLMVQQKKGYDLYTASQLTHNTVYTAYFLHRQMNLLVLHDLQAPVNTG